MDFKYQNTLPETKSEFTPESLCKCSISGLLFSPIFVQREETIGTRLLQWSHAFGQHQIFQSQFGCSNVPPPLPFQSLFFSFHSSPAATTEPRKKKKKNVYFPLNTGWLIGILTMVYSMAPDVT